MIEADAFISAARDYGISRYAGVPCSFLTPVINGVISSSKCEYVSAANEGDAVAIACGNYLGSGAVAVAMMQNSGLGNAVSPLTSLVDTFGIPVLAICTHRGAPGVKDEPQHELMGEITPQLLKTMRIEHGAFPSEPNDIPTVLSRATGCFKNDRPFIMVMQKGACASSALNEPARPERARASGVVRCAGDKKNRLKRMAVLEKVVDLTNDEDWIIVATTGFTGRELFVVRDRPNHFYMVGSMGCASSLGLGLAMTQPHKKVLVIDGDGAGLMRLGNFATAGAYADSNYFHLLLDNEVHDSTGAQATVSRDTDFAEIASACGYRHVYSGCDDHAIEALITRDQCEGANFLHFQIDAGTIENLPRPDITPKEVRQRLMQHLGNQP
ncbi:MAG: phosphonopyruvate decarboxylase [Pseudomonadota bacterium]